MQNENLTKKVIEILARVSGKPVSEIGPQSLLRQDLELDSLNFIELDFEIKHNGLPAIPEADLRDIQKVGDVVQLVLNHMKPAESVTP